MPADLKLDLLHRISIHQGKVHALTLFGTDHHFLLSGGFDLKLCLYNVTSTATNLKSGGDRLWPESAAFELSNSTSDSITAIVALGNGAGQSETQNAWVASRDGHIQILAIVVSLENSTSVLKK